MPERVRGFTIHLAILLTLGGLGSGLAVYGRQTDATQQVAHLLHHNWHYVDGVTQNGTVLTVTPTDSRIVHQDGSGGQPNPPLNLYGTHLQVKGDFAVTAHFLNRGNTAATLQLYDTPPIIADEFRIEPISLSVTEQDSTLSVQFWDGSQGGDVTQPKPAFSQQVSLNDPNSPVVISRVGSGLTVQAGTASISLDKGGFFHSGNIWFGLSTPAGSFQLNKLAAQGLNGGSVQAEDTTGLTIPRSSTGLQELAAAKRPDFTVGAAVALGPFMADSTYAHQALQNFGGITLENAMKPQFISPKQGVYTFQEADALIALAHQNGLKVHGHTLAFSEADPAWMQHLPTDTPAERQATTAILLDYVSHVMQHFKGQLTSLDVINEPLDTDQGTSLQHNIWYRAMGSDYMVQVSKLVHSIDPTVKQYVNENGAEAAGDRQDALLQLVQHINAKGGFIYGVGLQSHVYDMDTDTISTSDLDTTINRFGSAGFHVRVSENDVTDDSGTQAQTKQYVAVFTACLNNPNCVSYTTWGVNDRYDWFIDDDGSTASQGHDLLFNGSKPTPAYTALQQSLQ